MKMRNDIITLINKKETLFLKSLIQFIKFGIVGLSNTLISQLIYMICVALGAHYLAASIIAFIISVLNAFFWQNKYVFKEDEGGEKRIWWKVLLKTYAAYAFTGLFLANVLLIFWIEIIRIEEFTLPLTNMLNNFGINITSLSLTTPKA